MDNVVKIMKEDGVKETYDVYTQALIICKDTLDRRDFLCMETKEGRLKFLKICWDDSPECRPQIRGRLELIN